ncbi:ribosomal L7Ae/L30e/S12e/Gadd45 family protein [Paenibacillus sp. HWE-109]|uniref:L7Ae/L30e/S12e/Gadd45 family ribosomal protein n=1 Tax=Paenibacillus sp. HWE-109 TaxID=1306526 RepID=UPI001EDCCF2C|nr:ribosomal L7Ae/L30e/S12e/Gadd45 family protein [Paenibacillus sp. HWE-109]UKS29846.1 ribosomal L7Ae/L30e/S12e/Gadd45 family protein [Paenibacillus sp. HWE-109]
MNPKFLSQLGLAMRAGKLVTGDEGVFKAIRGGEAKLVIMAEDASANTRKKFQDKCQFYGVKLLEIGTKYELGRSIGKEMRVTIGVLDGGFAQMLQKSQENPAEVEHIDQ